MREIHRKRTGIGSPGAQKVIGAFMMALGLFGLIVASGSLAVFLGTGALFVFIGFWGEKNPVIVLHDDHLEMKVALATTRHLIRYSAVDEVVELGPNKVFLVVGGKRIRLPTAVIEPEDLEAVLAAAAEEEGES